MMRLSRSFVAENSFKDKIDLDSRFFNNDHYFIEIKLT